MEAYTSAVSLVKARYRAGYLTGEGGRRE